MVDTSTQSLLLHLEPPPRNASTSRLPTSPRQTPLSERLLRLWTERGDFSKFSLDSLKDDTADTSAGDTVDSSNQLVIGWGPEGEEEYGKLAQEQGHKGKEKEIDTSPMTMEEFVRAKEDIMAKLQIAQQSLYSSQALVSLLVASNKPRGSQQALALDGISAAATRPGSLVASRAESPAPSSSSVAGGAVGEKRHPAGSAAAVEAEFGLDPYSIVLTSIQRLDIIPSSGVHEGETSTGEQDEKGRSRIEIPEFENEAERDEYTKGRDLALAHKRQSMARAIHILRAGAKRLGGEVVAEGEIAGDELGGTKEATEVQTTAASIRSDASARRWRALRQAQSDGWGITPGRPGKSAHGAKMRLDEGEQDAWIGFGIPEAKPQYRRTALAYLRHDLSSIQQGQGEADDLVFPSRIKRRLRLRLILRGEGDALRQEKTLVSTQLQAERADDEKTSSLNSTLRLAQAELIDRELFDEIVAEARILSAKGVVTTHNTEQSVTIDIGSSLRLIFDMVASSNVESEQEAEMQGFSTTLRESVSSDPSALLSLVIAYARLSLVKRYQHRADSLLDSQTRPSTGATSSSTKLGSATSSNKVVGNDPSQSSNTRPVKSSSTTTTNVKPTTLLDLWEQSPFLVPLLALVHYLSFTAQLQTLLFNVSQQQQQQRQHTQMSYRFDPFESLTTPSMWIHTFLQGTPKEVKEAIHSLSGSGSVFLRQVGIDEEGGEGEGEGKMMIRLICRYPDELTVQLPFRKRVHGDVGVTLNRVGIAELAEIVKEVMEGR